jgi:FkbM family methyltransferase
MFYSQCGQDKYLENKIFKGLKDGLFVDVGAHDGKTFNNTLYFEEMHNWSGINIEPIPSVFDKLAINRPSCINLNCAIDITNNEYRDFMVNTGYTEMLSGLIDNYDDRHIKRIQSENTKHKSSSTIVKVNTRSLESIFDEHNIMKVNYLSIDVEGAEFSVLKSINFNKVFIDVIMFENNYKDTSIAIVKYLEDLDYTVVNQEQDIAMIHKKSKYLI